MSKLIQVSDDVYQALREVSRDHETFSETIERLLALSTVLAKAMPLIPQLYYVSGGQNRKEGG